MKGFTAVLTFGIIAALAAPAGAQQAQRTRDSSKTIPSDARPPKGMCRIWIDGVPTSQQPAPTDCPTAVKNKPANGRVIFGDDYADTTKSAKTKLPVKGFSGVKPPLIYMKRPPSGS